MNQNLENCLKNEDLDNRNRVNKLEILPKQMSIPLEHYNIFFTDCNMTILGEFKVNENMTIGELKRKIGEKKFPLKLQAQDLQLIYWGKLLWDDCTIGSYCIQKDSNIFYVPNTPASYFTRKYKHR